MGLTWRDIVHGTVDTQTGAILLLGLGDGKDDKGQITSFFEQVALIVTLLLTLAYPQFQEATSHGKVVEAQHGGLGIAWVAFSTLALSCCCVSSVLSILNVLMINGCHSESQVEYFVKVSSLHLRTPYFLFVNGIWAFFMAFLIEGWIRNAGYTEAQDGLDEDLVQQSEHKIKWVIMVLPVAVTMGSFISCMASAAHRYRTEQLFSTEGNEVALARRSAESAGQASWFACLEASESRDLLNRYYTTFDRQPFGDPNPDHFLRFCLDAVRSRGHGCLSDLDQRKIWNMFEEHVQQLLSDDHAKVDSEPGNNPVMDQI
jgi:hypothetical protein